VKQEVAPAGGFAPVTWKRWQHTRKMPLSFIFCTWATMATYSAYKVRLIRLEERISDWHYKEMQLRTFPALYAEEDRLKVRARKQHEADIALIVGPDSEWDPHRRTYQNDEIFVDFNRRELLPLLTDKERVALGGEPSRYSFNDMWAEHIRNKAYKQDWSVFFGKNSSSKLE